MGSGSVEVSEKESGMVVDEFMVLMYNILIIIMRVIKEYSRLFFISIYFIFLN